ncbi:formin-like protein 3 isoform X2 [Brassica napus]|uniref:formin-like protein 3 isoform X2 n=1 Tax=Brassica napus TaxID=3708 RepID=UPI0006AA99E8|nr:formin-like protein 3 isoform X2 [Brassica napus]
MLLLVGTPPRMTRSVSRRGEASASPTPSSLPLVITRRSNVSESACVSVTKSPPVLPSKPEPPDLFPVEQIEPLFETFPPPDPPFKTPSPPEPPDPPLKAPSPMCPPEPPDPPDVLKVKIITIADPPDHDHSGAPDLFSFTLKIAEPPHVSGSSRWCVVTSVAKFVAAFHAFDAAACSGSSSPRVSSDSHGFISLFSNLGISMLSCLCAMYASIHCVYVSRIAFDAAVYLTSMVALLYLNNFSMIGV